MGKIATRLPLAECVATHVRRDGVVGIGGLHFHNTPMAMVREIIRQEIPISRLIPPLDGSLNADQLIGAGLVEEVQIAYLGLEHFGMAGRFRAAAESGRLRVRDCEEGGFVLGLAAAAAGQPFGALPAGLIAPAGGVPGIATANADDYRPVIDPFTGREHMAVRAIAPDVALIHCQLIDARGNCGFLGGTFLDLELARAARICLVLAEREVDELPAGCRGHLPGYVVDAYCVLDGGAHPGSSHGLYGYDGEHIAAYASAARSDDGFARYRTETIGPSELHYRAAAGVPVRIGELAVRIGA